MSAITLAEIVYLVEKSRLPPTTLADLRAALADPKSVLTQIPVDEDVAIAMSLVSRDDVPDLPDRLIAATAQLHGVPVLSRDRRIQTSSLRTIW